MFFFLSKLIDFIAMPITILMGLLIWSFFTKNNKIKNRISAATIILLYLASNRLIVNKLAYWYETPVQSVNSVDKIYDVGVLLTGGITFAQNYQETIPSMGNRSDRVLQTFHLYKVGKIRSIIITGTDNLNLLKNNTGEAQLAKKLLTSWGVPEQDIHLELKARNTRENALFTTEILKKEFPEASVMLITSAFHMRRAHGCFEKAGTQTTPFRTDFEGTGYPLFLREKLVPNPTALSLTHTLWHEWIGLLVYKLMGYC
jgi:uncharacterized SAM-binding protein YcdF (DUF218 family)